MRKSFRISLVLPAQYRGGTARLAINLFKQLSTEFACDLFYLSSGDDERDKNYKDYILDGLDAQNRKDLVVNSFSINLVSASDATALINSSHYSQSKYVSSDCPSLLNWNGVKPEYYSTFEWNSDQNYDHILFLSHGVFSLYPVIYTSPFSVIVTDLLHRYVPTVLPQAFWMHRTSEYISCTFRQIRDADHVFCTTPNTLLDVQEYAGRSHSTSLIPMCSNKIENSDSTGRPPCHPYAVWVTNSNRHKNHLMMIDAIEDYFTVQEGVLNIVVTGIFSQCFSPFGDHCSLSEEEKSVYYHPYISKIRHKVHEKLAQFADRILFAGEVGDQDYFSLVSGAKYLIHNVIADNGTYSVIEAAQLGTPSISSDYPQMRYIENRFEIPLSFFNPYDYREASMLMKKSESAPRIFGYKLPRHCDWDHADFLSNIASLILSRSGLKDNTTCLTFADLLEGCDESPNLLAPFWNDYPVNASRWVLINAESISSIHLLYLVLSIQILIQKYRLNIKMSVYSKYEPSPIFMGLVCSSGLEYSILYLTSSNLFDSLHCSLDKEPVFYTASPFSSDDTTIGLIRPTHDSSSFAEIFTSSDLISDLMSILNSNEL